MKVKVKLFGLQELMDRMDGNGEEEVEFPGGSVNDLFGSLVQRHGFTRADFPLVRDWEENLSVMILRNEEILCKAYYATEPLAEGDRLSFHIHTGCC